MSRTRAKAGSVPADIQDMMQQAIKNSPHSMPEPEAGRIRLRLLSYNIQVGIGATRFHHYVTQSWKHVLPHPRRFEILNKIAHLISDYDVVALQESDAGSLRSHFISQTEYLAQRGRFPFWHEQIIRDMGKLGQHSLGLLSRYRPGKISEYKLPGIIPGRGAMMVRFGDGDHALRIIIIHLALGRRARMNQLDYITELVNGHDHVVLMGDMNCQPDSLEMEMLLKKTGLCIPETDIHTFPSWRPNRMLDHILATSSVQISQVQVLNHTFSDHLPIAMEITVPDEIRIV